MLRKSVMKSESKPTEAERRMGAKILIFLGGTWLLAGLFMSKRTNIARAFRPRLIGYTIMMLSNDRYISNTVLIHSILVPQMQIMVTIAGDKEIP